MKAFLLSLLIAVSCTAHAQRVVLVEYFTQASCAGCAATDSRIKTILDANPSKAVAIQYHTSFPGADPMNQPSPADVAARASYYSFSSLPRSAVEGRVINGGQPGFWNQDTVLARAAKPSPFVVKAWHRIKSQAGVDTVVLTVSVRRTGTQPSGSLVLHSAVVERNIHFGTAPGTNGVQDFDWVMKKMLPTATGQALPSLGQGDSVRYTFKWRLESVYDLSKIGAVVFVQNSTSKGVYQAAQSVAVVPVRSSLQNLGAMAKTAVPGETVEFRFTLTMLGPVSMPFRVKLVPDAAATPGVTAVLNDGLTQAADSLVTTAQNGAPLGILVKLTAPAGSPDQLRYRGKLVVRPWADSLSGLFTQSPIALMAKAKTLLVSLEEGSGATVESALSQRNPFMLSAEEFVELGPSLLSPLNYPHTVFHTGSQYSQTMTEPQKNAFMDYLNAGGRLAVVGQSFGYGTVQPATAYLWPFLSSFLGAFRRQAGTQFLSVHGEPTDLVFGRFAAQTLTGQPGQTAWPDMYDLYTTHPDAKVAFRYSNQQVAGTYVKAPAWRTVFLGFGIEQIPVAAIRRQIMNRIIDFFEDRIDGVAGRISIPALEVYPNPVSGMVRIRGGLRPGHDVAVQDLAGRSLLRKEIRTAEETELDIRGLAPGLYSVVLMEDGRPVGQGRVAINR